LVSTNNTTNECLKVVFSISGRGLYNNWLKMVSSGNTFSKLCLDEEVNCFEDGKIDTSCPIASKLKKSADDFLIN